LRAILDKVGLHYPFGMLKEIIKSGNAVEGVFDHEKLENSRTYAIAFSRWCIQHTFNMQQALTCIGTVKLCKNKNVP
jgi:hypothetical protein